MWILDLDRNCKSGFDHHLVNVRIDIDYEVSIIGYHETNLVRGHAKV